jgi:hypothetical protein
MDDVVFEHWLKKKNWSELEARYLLTGLTPFYDGKNPFLSSWLFPDKTEEQIEDINEEFKDNVKAILDGINYGSLEVDHATGDYLYYRKGWTAQPLDVLVATRYFNKAKLLKWAINEGLNIPKELINWYIKYQARLIPEYEQPLKIEPMAQNNEVLKAENESLKAENEALKKQIEEQSKDDLVESERDSLLKLVLGMAMAKYNYEPLKQRNNATGKNNSSIHSDLEKQGLGIKDNKTILKYLKEAQERFKKV